MNEYVSIWRNFEQREFEFCVTMGIRLLIEWFVVLVT